MHLEYLPRISTAHQRGVQPTGYNEHKRFNQVVPYHDALQVEYAVSPVIHNQQFWPVTESKANCTQRSDAGTQEQHYRSARVPDDAQTGYLRLMANPDVQYANPDRVPTNAMDLNPKVHDYDTEHKVPPVISALLIASVVLVGVALYNK